MSSADRLRQQAARATTRRTRSEPDQGDAGEASPETAGARSAKSRAATTPRTKTVRITLDLAPLQYRRLNRWCDDAADELGVARVTAASVLRELLSQLDDDPELSARIRARLADTAPG